MGEGAVEEEDCRPLHAATTIVSATSRCADRTRRVRSSAANQFQPRRGRSCYTWDFGQLARRCWYWEVVQR